MSLAKALCMGSKEVAVTTFAAVGDIHGGMHAMVALLRAWEAEHHRRLDFVLQVGDFEPHRDEADLETAAIPTKYRHVGDFPDFHSGRVVLPWPVHFIGGNHEPYGHLDQFPDGAELAPNCHYLGRVRRVEIAGVTVVGLTGIYAEAGLAGRPSYEAMRHSKKKLYTYFSEEDVSRAIGFDRADVLLLHEWPRGAIAPEQMESVAGRRRAGAPEAVGSDFARMVVDALEPRLVLAGHMHWAHRSTIGVSAFAALGHIDIGADALGVFEVKRDGAIVELAPLGAVPNLTRRRSSRGDAVR